MSNVKLVRGADGITNVRYPVAIYATDAVVGVQYSSDLKNWSDAVNAPQLSDITDSAKIYNVALPQSAGSKVFIRFKLSVR